MNICVAGWYFHEPLIRVLRNSKYPYFVVSHSDKLLITEFEFPIKTIPNVGLEFGCYDWYLKNEWKSGSVLFTHDDNEFTQEDLDLISSITADQAFIFSSQEGAQANGRAHGRAFFCSDRFLKRLKADGGFWYSEQLCDGSPIPPTTAEAPDYHNQGIQNFVDYLGRLDFPVSGIGAIAIIPGAKLGYRGTIAPVKSTVPTSPKSGKLNLCCGQSVFPGYINVDAFPNPGVDVVCDARDLQYDENSLDAVAWFHAIEHFSLDDACMLIRRIFRWLKPGGHLIIEGPDVFKAVKNSPGEFESICGIFGDVAELRKGKDGYQHKWGWTGNMVQQELASAGFNVGKVTSGMSHPGHEWRDYRVEGFKPKEAPHVVL